MKKNIHFAVASGSEALKRIVKRLNLSDDKKQERQIVF